MWACVYADVLLPSLAVRVVQGDTTADESTVLTAALLTHLRHKERAYVYAEVVPRPSVVFLVRGGAITDSFMVRTAAWPAYHRHKQGVCVGSCTCLDTCLRLSVNGAVRGARLQRALSQISRLQEPKA